MSKIFSIKSIFTLVICFTLSNIAYAQFWFGPKIGGQMVTHSYADKNYKNIVDVSTDFNYHFGFAAEYTTETNFAAHIDFLYQKVTNTVKNLPDTTDLLLEANYHFLTVPIMLKRLFGNGPVSYYVNFGPRISLWLKGDGKYYEDELQEFQINSPVDYKVIFSYNDDLSAAPFSKRKVQRPTRIQYAFDFGGGVQMDLNSGQKLVIDLAYSIGHSNMGFNVEDNTFPFFQQDVEFANNMMRFSIAYMFGYDPTYKRKGASNSSINK